IARLTGDNEALRHSMETLQESMADVVLALDDVGWRPLGANEDANEIKLDTIKNVAQTTRGLVAINPLIKRGVAVRTPFIWGEGVRFLGLDEKDPLLTDPANKKFHFSPQAYAELEACMATDGQIFTLITKPGTGRRRLTMDGKAGVAKITRVPMSE